MSLSRSLRTLWPQLSLSYPPPSLRSWLSRSRMRARRLPTTTHWSGRWTPSKRLRLSPMSVRTRLEQSPWARWSCRRHGCLPIWLPRTAKPMLTSIASADSCTLSRLVRILTTPEVESWPSSHTRRAMSLATTTMMTTQSEARTWSIKTLLSHLFVTWCSARLCAALLPSSALRTRKTRARANGKHTVMPPRLPS